MWLILLMDNLFKDYNRIHYHADELENNSSTLQLYKITGEIEIQNIDTHEAWNKFVETTQIKKVNSGRYQDFFVSFKQYERIVIDSMPCVNQIIIICGHTNIQLLHSC